MKETDIKNCTCYCFDDVIRFWDIDIYFSDILLDKKLYKEKWENILIYDILYTASTGAKSLLIRFNKTDELIKNHDKIRYLVLFDYSYFDNICDKIL